jgi:type II secretory pathway component PulF
LPHGHGSPRLTAMFPSIAANERAELCFQDLASALDAGLPLAAIGGAPAAGDRALHAAVQARGVQLTPTEDVVLMHGWRAGKAAATLRACAVGRAQRAAFGRQAWAGLRYPLVLAIALPFAAFAASWVIGKGPAVAVLGLYAALAAAFAGTRRAVRAGAAWPRRLPWAAGLLDAAAEIPYLETLHALYGAGVPMRQAHAAAVESAPPGQAAERLRIADRMVRDGRPLHEGLATALALHPESRQLLQTGEMAGQLEDALARALQRRRDVHGRTLAALGRGLGAAAYALTIAAVLWILVTFYSGYFAALKGLRGGR